MTTYCLTLFFLLALVISSSTHRLHGWEKIQMAQTKILRAKHWAQSFHDSKYEGTGALSDCAKLYSESEYRLSELLACRENMHTNDDAITWLSGVLANHRTCFDGLNQIGFVQIHNAISHNFTFLLTQALAFYGQTRINLTMEKTRRPAQNENGGILTSWKAGASRADFIVAKDGSGTHRTINEAISAVKRRGKRVIIYVKAGVYNEKVEIAPHVKDLMLVGDGIDKTIITGRRNVPDGDSTLSSATFGVSGDGFWARDITFENTAGPTKHQAVALRVSSDFSVFYRCSFKAYQDTLFVHSLRQFYRDCQIHGTIDFIFGDAPVVFQNCDIFVRRPMNHQANFITAQGRDNPHENTGIVIHKSRVQPSPEFLAANNSIKTYLGRPWKEYSRTVFIETDLDGFIDPSGWGKWHGDFALETLFYAEYRNRGSGASTISRVKWPGFHVLNSPQQASPFTVSMFIQGESWIPATGVPFDLGT